MIEIDGSTGEGGGQVLRSALALSMVIGQSFLMTNIRVNRSQPGLRPQHLQAVKAACEISRGQCEGADLGSSSLEFYPQKVHPGRYRFDIGTAGSTSLVLQTILLPLSRAGAASSISIKGGTHVPNSPSFHYLDYQYLPSLRRMGFEGTLNLESAGFYPEGGGKISATIRPIKEIQPLQLVKRGDFKQIRGLSAVANLDRRIAERQRNQVLHRLGDRYLINDLRIAQIPARNKGTTLLLLAEFEHSQACFFSLGELGKPAERVADEAVDSFGDFLESGGAVDHYLADQILLPLSFAAGKSVLRTSRITNHLTTNAAIIQKFVPVRIEIDGEVGSPGTITILPV
jgi:RNA 3'-terminal phosphate cyclase (ATP)